jgi:DNA polymerase-3 subunit delta
MRGKSEKEIGSALRLFGDRQREIMTAARNLPMQKIEQCLLILASYSAKAVGIGTNMSNGDLLKEMIGKMELVAMA